MSGVKKRPRSLALAPDLEEKLLKLCEQLGVNPHAYLVNEVGKAVNRDYLQFQVASNQKAALEEFMGKMEAMMVQETKNNGNSD
jgi:predicted DNA-binding protein